MFFKLAIGTLNESVGFLLSLMVFITLVSMHISILLLYALSCRVNNLIGKTHKYIKFLTTISLLMFLYIALYIFFSVPLLVNSVILIYFAMSLCTVILFSTFVAQLVRYLILKLKGNEQNEKSYNSGN